MDEAIRKFQSENGKKSWEKRNTPKEKKRLKEISAKGVAARKKNATAKIVASN